MVEDKISNLINGLKTASAAKKDEAVLPYSKLNVAILDILKKNEYIVDYEIKEEADSVKKALVAELKYEGSNPAIHDVKRISKFSKRIYKGIKEISPVKRGYGMMVMTTSQGLMTGVDAKKAKVGGEALFQIW